MPTHLAEPETKRTVAFFDGQNVFYSVKQAFGYTYSNFSPPALAHSVCARESWSLVQTRFYTGIPDETESPFWHTFWGNKLAALRRLPNVYAFSRALRYNTQDTPVPTETPSPYVSPEKKALMSASHRHHYPG